MRKCKKCGAPSKAARKAAHAELVLEQQQAQALWAVKVEARAQAAALVVAKEAAKEITEQAKKQPVTKAARTAKVLAQRAAKKEAQIAKRARDVEERNAEVRLLREEAAQLEQHAAAAQRVQTRRSDGGRAGHPRLEAPSRFRTGWALGPGLRSRVRAAV